MQTNVYVINLQRRPDRWKEISAHLNGCLIRVDAIDAQRLEVNPHHLVSDAAAACWLSHQLAWNIMVSNGDDYSLILEDDAQLRQGFTLEEILPAASNFMASLGIDMLQVGFFQEIGRKRRLLRRLGLAKRGEKDLTISNFLDGALPNRHGIGTHAYVISRAGALKLSVINNPVFLAADAALMYLAAGQSRVSKISIWQIPISIFSQRPLIGGNFSDIQ